MRKISEINGEDALDVLADIVEPMAEILSDKQVTDGFRSGMMIQAVKAAIKGHKKAVLEVMATLDGEPVETYAPNLVTLPVKIMELLNDPMLQGLFSSESQTDAASSGSATESIEAREK